MCVCESPRSNPKRAPPPNKISWRNAPGSPDPQPNTQNNTITTQGGDQPSALEGHPGPHSGEGRARSPVLAFFGEITYSGFLEKVWLQTQQKGKTKATKKRHRNTLAASHPERAPHGMLCSNSRYCITGKYFKKVCNAMNFYMAGEINLKL